MKLRKQTYRLVPLLVLPLLSACGGSTPGLSGTLASTESFAPFNSRGWQLAVPSNRPKRFEMESGDATKVACVTAAVPPVKVEANVGSGGDFNVSLTEVSGEPMTCTVLDATNEIMGTFLFQNENETGFGGGAKAVDTVALSSAVDVGTVEISGSQIAVDAADLGITTSGLTIAAADAFDPTGVWQIGDVDFTLPEGYVGPCDPSDMSCRGPQDSQSIYIKRVVGKTFTPDSTCAAAVADGSYAGGACSGTTGSDDAFAFSIWMAKNTFLNCGDGTTGAIGFTENQAKAYGQVDLSGDSDTLHQAFDWSTSGPSASTITEGWKSTAATAAWDVMDCASVTLGGKSVWKCKDGAGRYSLSYGGGCVNSSNSPVQPDSWSNVDFAGGSCTTSTITLGSVSLDSNSCTVTYTPSGGSAQTLTCGGAWGNFNADGTAYGSPVTPTSLVSSGAACSGIATGGSDSKELSKLQCYANYFYNTLSNSARTDTTLCLKDIRTNWGATTAADFIADTGFIKPVNQAMTEKVTYLSSDVAAMTQLEDNYEGLQVESSEGSAWVACHTKVKNSITMTKIDSTHMVIKFVTETRLADDKTACKAAASDETSSGYQQLRLGKMRMLFKMTRTGS